MGGIRLLSALYHFCTFFCGDYGVKVYVLLCKNLIIIIMTCVCWLSSSCPKEGDDMSWHWRLGERMGVGEELIFPCKVKYWQLQRQSVCGGKYLWEGRSWAQRCWAWSEQPTKMIISFLWCPANGDKALSFINSQPTCQRQHPWLQPNQNSWQIFHFLLFIVSTKSPCSWQSWREWKVKACDIENRGGVSAKRCDKAFPSFKMHTGSGRAISRVVAWGTLLPPTCRDSPGNVEKPPGVVGFFVSTKAYVFPGEMLWMLWNLT